MSIKILCVDDEPNILSGYQRSLRKQFEIETALSGPEALTKMEENGPYAVLVTDMRMPGMDGIAFLKEAQKAEPNSVRIMLTGNADQQTAANAVNEGHVFRFLNKPCSAEDLAVALTAGLEQYRLITAEKELLEKTLGGTIRVLMEILAMVDPELFGRAQTLRLNMRLLSADLLAHGIISENELWPLELAALLSQVGTVTVPSFVVSKVRQGLTLSETEQKMWQRVPEISHNLLRNIPRLEPVAEIVRYQHKHFDGTGIPQGPICGELIPRGARMLKVLLDLLELETGPVSRAGAFALLQRQGKRYDPEIVAAARRCFVDVEPSAPEAPSVRISLSGLRAGQVLAEDIHTTDGKVILTAGRRISDVLLEKLRNYAALADVSEPIYVRCAK
jgi:response regulator RpfG family c-di-GMP phosphodiesterase